MIFKDRVEAGQKLSIKLHSYKDNKKAIILGLPRGGVVIANEIANNLNLPLDIIVTRKIGAPGQPELAVGAITEEGEAIYDGRLISSMEIPQSYLDKTKIEEYKEAQRRLKLYRGKRPPLKLQGQIAIIVDDGIATGATMEAAIKSARQKGAKKIIVAVPVLPSDTVEKIKKLSDELIYIDVPAIFWGVGGFYENFPQVTDEEVIKILKS